MSHGRKRDAPGLDALAAEAERAGVDDGAIADDGPVKTWKKLRVPPSFIAAVRERTGVAGFAVQGFQGAPATWAAVTATLRGVDGAPDADVVGALQRRVRELEAQVHEAQSESVASILARGGHQLFSTHFGVTKAEFDFIYTVAEADLENMRRVFSQQPAGGVERNKPLGIAREDVLGIICRHLVLGQPFARICKGFPRMDKKKEKGATKSENWVRKIFDAGRDSLAADGSSFSQAFLRRQTPPEVWSYMKRHRPEVVEFLREYVKDFSPKRKYYVVLVDGTHFVSKTVSAFYAMGLTYSRKKAQNTLLSVCGSVATGMFAFYTEPVGGKTSEKAACDAADMFRKIVDFAVSFDMIPVLIVDKGFGFFVKYAAAEGRGACSVFIPYGARAGKQLTVAEACFNREQARIRMPIEHSFGALKRRCLCLKWGALQLGAPGIGELVQQALRLSSIIRVAIGFHNAFRLAADPGIVFEKDTRRKVCSVVFVPLSHDPPKGDSAFAIEGRRHGRVPKGR